MRHKCDNPNCISRKPAHRMRQVLRSRQDPTPIGLACSDGCVRVIIAADAERSAPAIPGKTDPTFRARALGSLTNDTPARASLEFFR